MAAKARNKAAPAAGRGGLRLPQPDARWRWLLLAGGVCLLLAVLYPGPMFQGQVFGSADANNSEAFTRVGDAELAAGDYPLWNPYLFAGMPSFGSLAYVKFLYPPSAVFNFLQQTLRFPSLTWMLGHLLFGGLGMAWLLSRWKLPAGAILLGVAAFLLFPRIVAWGAHGHGSKLGAAMYLPWLVGWTLRVLEGRGARAVGMVGLLLGLQLLRGHVQITYYSLLTVGWLSLWNAFLPLDEALARASRALRWRRLGLVVGGLAVGFLIGAVMLVPVHGYADISIRGQDTAGGGGVGLDYATGWSLAPDELGTFILPAAAGFGGATYMGRMPFTDYPNYFGVLLLLLAAAAWSRESRSLVLAALAMSLLAVFVAFGNFGFGLYELLYDHLPFFNKFRVPSMILVLPAFALAILTARGAARWTGGADPGGRPVVLPALLAGAGVIMLLAGAAQLAQGPYREAMTALAAKAGRQAPPVLLDEAWRLHRDSLIRIGLILLTAGAAGWAAVRNPGFRRQGLVWVLGVLLVLDLMGVNGLITHPDRGVVQLARTPSGDARLVTAGPLLHAPARLQTDEPAAGADDLAKFVGHERVWPLGSHAGRNTWMTGRVASLGGYHPAKLARFEKIRARLFGDMPAGRVASWLAGAGVVFDRPFSPEQVDALRGLGCDVQGAAERAGDVWVHRNAAALPRARLVGRWAPAGDLPGGGDLDAFLDALQGGRIDVAGVVHLDAAPEPAPVAADELPAPVFTADRMNEVALTTAASTPAVLVLADMNAPGWRVEIDGRPAPLLTADLVLRAVAVPAGEHTVRFTYHDPAVRTGLLLTLAGALAAAGLIAAPLLRRRTAAAAAAGTGDAHE